MNIQSVTTRLTFLGSVAMLLAAGIVGCSSPVATPDDASATPLSKKTKTTATVWETEPNNDPSTASDVISIASGYRMGYISTATDNDYFLTQAVPAGRRIVVTLNMPMTRDYDVQLLAADGVTVLASNHNGAGIAENLFLTNTSLTSEAYKLRVFSADGSYATTSPYSLIVSLVN